MSESPPDTRRPRIVVLSQLYPRSGQEGAGLFVHERMRRVARELPLVVVAPAAWFPFQGLIRRFRPHFRPPAPRRESVDGIEVHCPRWLSVPGVLKSLDAWLLALCTYPALRRLQRQQGFDILDAHFGYPDGRAAVLLARWLGVRVTVTLRGNEARRVETAAGRRQIARTVLAADRVFTVSESLRQLALELGASPERVETIPNGVDTRRFRPVDRDAARRRLGLPAAGPLLITVGTLVERKGFHRVIEVLPRLREHFPDLGYVIVGGAGPEGDRRHWLQQQAASRGVESAVHFLGPMPPDELHAALSAANVFVLATAGEGWANVFLEAMACGLPVVTTDVGGNHEVVCRDALGRVVPFGDRAALENALVEALARDWDREGIRRYALDNGWETRIGSLVAAFRTLAGSPGDAHASLAADG